MGDIASGAVVPLIGRGDLPAQPLHARALWLHAVDSLARVVPEPVLLVEPGDRHDTEATCRAHGVTARVLSTDEWPDGIPVGPLLVHDPLCPLVPQEVLLDFVRLGDERPDTSFAAFRPVTDTVKTAVDGRIVGTVDRDRLAALTSPVLVAAAAAAGVSSDLLGDPQSLVRYLRRCGPTELVMAPSIARRVEDESAIHLLECVDELERRLRHPG